MIRIEAPLALEAALGAKAACTRFLNRTRSAVGLPGNIDVLLTDDATLRRLNRAFRGKNQPTDVLSFPAAGDHTSHPVAGDLAISLETAARQAAEHGHTLALEVRILILHGVLHLAGYDHENDAGEMAEREAELRRELRLPTSLIARARGPVAARTSTTSPRSTKPAAPPARPSAKPNRKAPQ